MSEAQGLASEIKEFSAANYRSMERAPHKMSHSRQMEAEMPIDINRGRLCGELNLIECDLGEACLPAGGSFRSPSDSILAHPCALIR